MHTAYPTKLTLIDLLSAAGKHYNDNYLAEYFDQANGGPRHNGSGDTLAEFIVREISDTFDAHSSRIDQVAAAVRSLEQAKEDIQNAIEGLKELRDFTSTPLHNWPR